MNGRTTIVNVKGTHNHPVNIKRNKPISHLMRRRTRAMSQMSDMKVETLMDEYQDFIIEEDDENINV